jgi:hypothetical protein
MLVCYFHTSTPALPLKYAGVPSVFTNSAHSLGAWASPCETASPRQTKHASSGDAPGPTSTDTRIPWGRGHPTCLRAGCVIRCSTVLCFATRAHSLNLCAEPPVSRRHPPIFYASLAPARLSLLRVSRLAPLPIHAHTVYILDVQAYICQRCGHMRRLPQLLPQQYRCASVDAPGGVGICLTRASCCRSSADWRA